MTALLVGNLVHLGVAAALLSGLLAVLHLQERLVSRRVAHHLGWRAVLLTGWLGVPLHELSHLVMSKLFGHRLIAWKLFEPDPVSGTLGYVRHAYSRRSLWQLGGTFIIGVAPLLVGASALAVLLGWMLPTDRQSFFLERLAALSSQPPATCWRSLADICAALAATLWETRSPLLLLQLYLAVCVAHHMAPSAADLKGCLPGLGLVLPLLLGAAATASAFRLSLGFLPALVTPLLLLLPLTTALLVGWALLAGLLGRLAGRARPASSGAARYSESRSAGRSGPTREPRKRKLMTPT